VSFDIASTREYSDLLRTPSCNRINFSVSLPAFPRSSQLQEIRGFVEGKGTWKSLQPGGLNFPGIPYRLPVFTLTEKDFELEEDNENGSGQSEYTVKLSGATTYRLPDDRNIGPSTPKGVRSPAKSNHALVFEFHVLAEGAHQKIITIREKVEIASVSSLTLFTRSYSGLINHHDISAISYQNT
jgi:hypothetical protein